MLYFPVKIRPILEIDMNIADVLPKIQEIIADVLVLDEEEVQPNSRLIADLGAESIDFLDLVFQLEKEFKIKIPRGQLEKDSRGDLSEDEFATGGVVTDEGMLALKAYFSELPAESFTKNIKVNEIATLFTVETFGRVVLKAVSEKEVTTGAATA